MKILKELRKAMDRNAYHCKKELEAIRSCQETLENSFAETKAELKATNNRMNNAEERISDLQDRIMEITQSGRQTESLMKKIESNKRDLWDNIKCANLCIIGISEGEDREKGIENVFEKIMAESFPNLKKGTDI